MDSYKFLFKPIFFIFNLVFATWMVITIEKIKPSDFGRYEGFFKTGPDKKEIARKNKLYLKQLIAQYKSGQIDAGTLDKELEKFTATK